MTVTQGRLTMAAALLLITAACLLPLLQNGFINRDDPAYITENPLIRELSFGSVARIFSTPQFEGDYHPLTLTAFAIEHSFFGDAPFGYHAVSLFLHLLSTALVFIVALQLSGRAGVAAIVALLFGIHPAQVESVAWASQQKDLLSALWFLGSLGCYIRYAAGTTRRKTFYALSFLMFVLSVLSKAMGVSLAAVLFLTDYLLKREARSSLLLEKLPYLVVALAAGLWAIHMHNVSGATLDVVTYGTGDRLLLSGVAVFRYLEGLFLPFTISTYHPYPFLPGGAPLWMIAYPAGVLALVAVALLTHRHTRVVLFGIGFFLLNIATVVQLVPLGGAFGGNRYTYVASLGIFALFAAFSLWIWQRQAGRSAWRRRGLLTTLGLLILTLCLLSHQRTGIWNNSVSLWSDVLAKYPDVAFLYAYRGNARHLPEEQELALADYDKALRLNPDLAFAYFSRGAFYAELGNHEAAVADYTSAIRFGYYHPADCYNNRGSSYTALGKFDSAIADFSRAVQIAPESSDAFFNRAGLYLRLGQYRQAISDLDELLRFNERDTVSLYDRGIAKQLTGDAAGGCADLERAAGMNFPPAASAYRKYCR